MSNRHHPHITTHDQNAYYAVRQGKHVRNCIFLSWDAVKEHIVSFDKAEYSIFDDVLSAIEYLDPVNDDVYKSTSDGPHVNSTSTIPTTTDHTSDNMEVDPSPPSHDSSVSSEESSTERGVSPFIEENTESKPISIATTPTTADAAAALAKLSSSSSTTTTMATIPQTARLQRHLPRETETQLLNGRVVHKRRPSKKWMAMFRQLQAHRLKTGSFYICPTDVENAGLKRWIFEQKHQHKCYLLGRKHFSSQMKRELLNSIGFDFEFHSFDERCEQLKKFKEDNGHVDVPDNDPLLGSWMRTQKRQLILFNKGKECKLTQENVNKLHEIGVDVVNVEKPIPNSRAESAASIKKWDEMFEELRRFHVEHGHCVITKADDDHQALYKWMCQQRLEYKKLRKDLGSKMTASRLQKLHDIGFTFNTRSTYLRWEDRMEQLRQYKQEHGHLRIPVVDPDLGEFVARQRVEHAKYCNGKPSHLTEERIRDLTQLGFIFQVGKRRVAESKIVRKTWDERFDELVAFKEQHGHTLVPQNTSSLGEWVHKQRKSYKLLKNGLPSSLSTERALKLADVGFIFDASAFRRGRKIFDVSLLSGEAVPIPQQDQVQLHPHVHIQDPYEQHVIQHAIHHNILQNPNQTSIQNL